VIVFAVMKGLCACAARADEEDDRDAWRLRRRS
jgi:hypothetical protein